MTNSKPAVALAVRAHPRGGPHSGDPATAERLRRAAAAVGRESPGAVCGPSTVTLEGTLLLPIAEPSAVLAAVRAVADELRPAVSTFCAAFVEDGEKAGTSGHDSIVLAADSAAREALAGIEETDVRERRVRLLGPGSSHALEALFDLLLVTYDGMTHRQRQIVALARSSDTQQQVATHLDVSRQAVNQSLASAEWSHLRRAEHVIESRLASGRGRGPKASRPAPEATDGEEGA
jgi:hypothetical protein